MQIPPLADYPVIEIRSFKWPHRATGIAMAYLLGEDDFGKWAGIARGNPWRDANGPRTGIFELSFVKVFPANTFWTACFGFGDNDIDVDISLPVTWVENAVEEVDLELDVLRAADGRVYTRDEDKFQVVRDTLAMPPEIAERAQQTFAQIQQHITQGIEPFSTVGFDWVRRFLREVER